MEYSPEHKAFWIIAGHQDTEPVFGLYQWSGDPATSPTLKPLRNIPADFSPEALFSFGGSEFWMLSDDGALPVPVTHPSDCTEEIKNGCCENKSLTSSEKKYFRAVILAM
jgi:hypothetical protein